jgi:hypothetical protein
MGVLGWDEVRASVASIVGRVKVARLAATENEQQSSESHIATLDDLEGRRGRQPNKVSEINDQQPSPGGGRTG